MGEVRRLNHVQPGNKCWLWNSSPCLTLEVAVTPNQPKHCPLVTTIMKGPLKRKVTVDTVVKSPSLFIELS